MTETLKHKQKKKPRWKTRPPVNVKEENPREKRPSLFSDFGFKAAIAVDLPIDIVAGVPHLEFSGNREVVVEGCRGIIDYDENMTTLDLGKMRVRFMGSSLELRNFTDHSVIVNGYITSVEFLT